MAKNKFQEGDHVIVTKGSDKNKHGNVIEARDSFGTPVASVQQMQGGSTTYPEDMLSGTGMCGHNGNRCPQR